MINTKAIIDNMTISYRKDGRYQAKVTIKGVRKSFYGRTESEVKQKVKEYIKKVDKGFSEPNKMTLNEFVEQEFLPSKKTVIEQTSYTRMCRIYNNQIKDSLGKMAIGKIQEEDVKNLIEEYASPSDKSKKPLARSGLKKILQFLRPCFRLAVKRGLIPINPCEDVVIPKEQYCDVKTKEQFSLNDSQLEKFRVTALAKFKTTEEYRSRNALVLLLILNLGVRAGEMLVLNWDDIDFDNRIVRINKTLQCGIKSNQTDGPAYVTAIKDSTKTLAGMRSLKLNDAAMFYLDELKEYDKRNKIQSPYVCCCLDGTLNSHRNLQRNLKAIAKQSGLPEEMTLHTLRHTFGSVLIRNGVGVEVVSKLMGHANITITYNKYIHTIKEQEAKAMEINTIC